jgi:uracil-DNA glycosylase family 4
MKPASCAGCPYFNNDGPVWGRGNVNAKLVTIAQNPWKDEWEYKDESGRGMPLVGASGRVYTRNAEAAGINREREFTTNIVKCCVPPGTRLDPVAIAKCKPLLEKELSVLPRAQTILTLGQEPFNSLTGKELAIVHTRAKPTVRASKATTNNPNAWLRGCPIRQQVGSRSFTIIPAAHPSYIMRTGFREAPILEADFRKAKRWAEGGGVIYAPQICTNPSSVEVNERIGYVLAQTRKVGLDIETPFKRSADLDDDEIVFQAAADRIDLVGLATSRVDCIEIPTDMVELIEPLFGQPGAKALVTIFTFNGGFDLGNIASRFARPLSSLLKTIRHFDLMLALNCLYTDVRPKDLAMAMSLFTDMPYTKNLHLTDEHEYNAADSIGALWGGEVAQEQMEDMPAYARN